MPTLYDLARVRPRKARNPMMDYSNPNAATAGAPGALPNAGTNMGVGAPAPVQPGVSTVGAPVKQPPLAPPAESTIGVPLDTTKGANGLAGAPVTGGVDPMPAAAAGASAGASAGANGLGGSQFGILQGAAPAPWTPTPAAGAVDPVSGGAAMGARRLEDQAAREAQRAMNRDRSPEAMAAREARRAALYADPNFVPNNQQALTHTGSVGPNQYIDSKGQLQYGYGEGDPRNNQPPLYDDPRNNIKGTLGPKPGFDYNDPRYNGGNTAQYAATAATARDILKEKFLLLPNGKPDWATMGTAAFFNSLTEAQRKAYVAAKLGTSMQSLAGGGT